MKKRLIVFIFLAFVVVFVYNGNRSEDNFVEKSSVKKENLLSMMIEQTAGSGDYELETRSSWPTDGYIFNETLSRCENGSKLSWNEEVGTISFHGNTTDKCYVYFDKYQLPIIVSSNVDVSTTSITITINANAGTKAIDSYYYSIDNGKNYINDSSNTYTFSGLTAGTYNVKYYVKDVNGKISDIVLKNIAINDLLANYIKSQYTGTQGENNLYYHDSNLTNGAGDNSYRYAGAHDEVNNFVCFGSDEEICPDDNLYRIIGVFDVTVNEVTESRVKLIKWDYANSDLLGEDGDYNAVCSSVTNCDKATNKGTNAKTSIGVYYWNNKNEMTYDEKTYYNAWSVSKLNKTNLNTNYINNIGNTWANKIATTTWIVAGSGWEAIGTAIAKNAYKKEIISPNTTVETTYDAKIGLMYVSDYGFAASSSAWSTAINGYNTIDITSINWMYMGIFEWSITPQRGNYNRVFYVNTSGDVSGTIVYDYAHAIRPTFYLNSDVTKIGNNTGTKIDPIRIN